MRTFLLKVTTTTDFKDVEEFVGRLEDVKLWIYNPQTEMAEERGFKQVIVLETQEWQPFG